MLKDNDLILNDKKRNCYYLLKYHRPCKKASARSSFFLCDLNKVFEELTDIHDLESSRDNIKNINVIKVKKNSKIIKFDENQSSNSPLSKKICNDPTAILK